MEMLSCLSFLSQLIPTMKETYNPNLVQIGGKKVSDKIREI